MYVVKYHIQYTTPYGVPSYTPDYTVCFQETNTLQVPHDRLLMVGHMSFEKKNPGCDVISIRIVSNECV